MQKREGMRRAMGFAARRGEGRARRLLSPRLFVGALVVFAFGLPLRATAALQYCDYATEEQQGTRAVLVAPSGTSVTITRVSTGIPIDTVPTQAQGKFCTLQLVESDNYRFDFTIGPRAIAITRYVATPPNRNCIGYSATTGTQYRPDATGLDVSTFDDELSVHLQPAGDLNFWTVDVANGTLPLVTIKTLPGSAPDRVNFPGPLDRVRVGFGPGLSWSATVWICGGAR